MVRIPFSTLVLVITVSWVFPPISEARPPQTLKGWGGAVDPKGDCRIGLDGEKLTIAVPGTKHDLSAEASDMNAPRVLREIEGDFIVQLKVSGNVHHVGDGLRITTQPITGPGCSSGRMTGITSASNVPRSSRRTDRYSTTQLRASQGWRAGHRQPC